MTHHNFPIRMKKLAMYTIVCPGCGRNYIIAKVVNACDPSLVKRRRSSSDFEYGNVVDDTIFDIIIIR